jgi:hypothetical protein
MQLMGNRKGQSMLPALGQAAMSTKPTPMLFGGAESGIDSRSLPGMRGQQFGGVGMNGQGSGIGTQQMIPQFGGASQFLNGPASQMGGYQSQMWNQQRVNPQLNFDAPRLNAMPAPQQPQQPWQQPQMNPGNQPWMPGWMDLNT